MMGVGIQVKRSQWTGAEELRRRAFYLLCSVAPGLMSRLLMEQFLTPQRRGTSPREQAFRESAQVLSIPHNGSELAGYAWGEGPTVLLVHGWEGRASNLRPFVAPLVQRGFRVVAFDLPGHGASPGTQTDLVDAGRAIRAAIAQVGPVQGVVAHSFGAAATMLLLGWQPEVWAGRVVLVGAPAELRGMVAQWVRARHLPERVIDKMQQVLAARVGEPMEIFSLPTVAASMRLPGLVVHDRQDPVAPFAGAEEVARRWRGARLLATDGLGHRSPLRSPKVIQEVAAFLAREEDSE